MKSHDKTQSSVEKDAASAAVIVENPVYRLEEERVGRNNKTGVRYSHSIRGRVHTQDERLYKIKKVYDYNGH